MGYTPEHRIGKKANSRTQREGLGGIRPALIPASYTPAGCGANRGSEQSYQSVGAEEEDPQGPKPTLCRICNDPSQQNERLAYEDAEGHRTGDGGNNQAGNEAGEEQCGGVIAGCAVPGLSMPREERREQPDAGPAHDAEQERGSTGELGHRTIYSAFASEARLVHCHRPAVTADGSR